MKRSTFAGLDVLGAGDPISIDGGAAVGRNFTTIDQYLSQIPGHHHTGAGALPDPSSAPGVTPAGAIGHLPLDTTLYATYTLIDAYGGETAAAPFVSFSTAGGIGQPPPLASAALNFTSGSLSINVYSYVFTITDATGGETVASLPLRLERDPGPASACVLFTGLSAMIAATPGGHAWRLYKGVGGAPYAYLAGGTSNTFVDTGLIALTFGVLPPSFDSTNQTGSFNLDVPYSSAAVGGFKVYLSTVPTFTDPCLYGQFPQASGDTAINISSVSVGAGSPPPVSTAVKMPSKINPATEIEGWETLGLGGGGGGSVPGVWRFTFSPGNEVLFAGVDPQIGGEFSSFGADGMPNAQAIVGTLTIPAAPSGFTVFSGASALVVAMGGTPAVINLASAATAGITLYGTITVSDLAQNNVISVNASAGVLPSDSLGTTISVDSTSICDWTTGVVVQQVGTELVWDPSTGQIYSNNLAGVYAMVAQAYATSP